MFTVRQSSRFERDITRLTKKNRAVASIFERSLNVLEVDPFNLSRMYRVKKLTDITKGNGQWRLRIDKYRIRYDISNTEVILHSIKPRKDAYR